jgi:hypothetical protein
MLNEIIAANTGGTVDRQLLNSAQKYLRSENANPADGEQSKELAGDEDACCYSVTRYFRVSHYKKYFDVTTNQVIV